MQPAQVNRGIPVPSTDGSLEPLERLAVVSGDAQALLIQPAQADHGVCVAVAGGFLEPRVRLAVIFADAPAILIYFSYPSRIYHCCGLKVLVGADSLLLCVFNSLPLFTFHRFLLSKC